MSLSTKLGEAGCLAPAPSPRTGRVAEDWKRRTEISNARRNKALVIPELSKKNQAEDKSREAIRPDRVRIKEDAWKKANAVLGETERKPDKSLTVTECIIFQEVGYEDDISLGKATGTTFWSTKKMTVGCGEQTPMLRIPRSLQ